MFTSHKQYSFALTFSENPKKIHQTKYTAIDFTFSKKKQFTNLQKQQLQKTFCPVCMLSLQLASTFFIPCDNLKKLFFAKVYQYPEVYLSAMFLRSLTPYFAMS